MKRIFAMLIALTLLSGCAAAEEAAEPADWVYEIVERKYPMYLLSPDQKSEEDFPLYFADGAEDFPFVDLRDWCEILNDFFAKDSKYAGYQVTATIDVEDIGIVTLRRENGSMMTCNFADGEIVFNDYNAFRQDNSGLYLNVAWITKRNPEQPDVLGVTGSRERLGKSVTLHLKEYGIPMIAQEGKYLVPLQTLSFLNLSSVNVAGYFNRKELIFCEVNQINNPDKELVMALYGNGFLTYELWSEAEEKTKFHQEKIAYILETISRNEEGRQFIESEKEKMRGTLSEIYYSGPKGERSEALAAYGYSELCMELDYEYGLQDAHHINGFAEYFDQTGLTAKLLDLDASVADNAIGDLTDYWFDDGHSVYVSNSYLADFTRYSSDVGFNTQQYNNLGEEIGKIRSKYENAYVPYYETGNTAYITFDEFMLDPSVKAFSDYYRFKAEGKMPNDTIAQLIEAHRKITRENSPIQNVVLDLSCNSGGATCVGVFALCWFLGEAQLSVTDPLTGAESTVSFMADVNLDHQYDKKDNLSHLNLYCLISPQSFSCANLVPWAFKADGRVTLLGKTSGGGSCVVRGMATSWGTTYQISGSQRMSFVKNGSYYDVDRGVEPDCFIRDYNCFYDREALSEIIKGIK